jgi:hypothetical protein
MDRKESGMIGFVIFGRVGYAQSKIVAAMVAIAVSMVFTCLMTSGCKRHVEPQKPVSQVENVFTNRINNPAYVEALDQSRRVQESEALELRSVMQEMKKYREKVKAALPPSTNEVSALDAALANDETWVKLKTRQAQLRKTSEQTLQAARARIREALLEEARARQAVAAGQARAVDEDAIKNSQTQAITNVMVPKQKR